MTNLVRLPISHNLTLSLYSRQCSRQPTYKTSPNPSWSYVIIPSFPTSPTTYIYSYNSINTDPSSSQLTSLRIVSPNSAKCLQSQNLYPTPFCCKSFWVDPHVNLLARFNHCMPDPACRLSNQLPSRPAFKSCLQDILVDVKRPFRQAKIICRALLRVYISLLSSLTLRNKWRVCHKVRPPECFWNALVSYMTPSTSLCATSVSPPHRYLYLQCVYDHD
jgi:hypothetical protein